MKPPECIGCPLYTKGEGFALPSGPEDAVLCFVGEALGKDEVAASRPFVGAAGRKLDACIGRLGMTREQVRVANVISCRPPGNELVGTSYEHGATAHCKVHRAQWSGQHTTYVTLGVTATRTMLKELLAIDYGGKLENWHGYINTSPFNSTGYPMVVPTYHPSHLIQGQQRLTGVFLHDIQRAMEVASFGFTRQPVSLVCDPPPEWFSEWVAAIPDDCWMAVDIETSMKMGSGEDDLEVPVGEITRINFSYHPDEGVTVPWDGRYLAAIEKALQSPCSKVFWNENYDVPILRERAKMEVKGQILDGMWAWHFLQSDLPKGLGFVAPFYSDLPPWKHLSDSSPAQYGAMDGVQQLRLMFGIAKDLKKSGQWESFLTNVVQLDRLVLHPSEQVGVLLDSARMVEFQARLKQYEARVFDNIQAILPDEVKPLAPKGGWKRPPKGYAPELVITREIEVETLMCDSCGEEDVSANHQCATELE
jgi:DNA polymerase